MKTLELEKYGVKEISKDESEQLEGGFGFILPLVAAAVEAAGTLLGAAQGAMVWDIFMNPGGSHEVASKGYSDGKKAAYADAMK